MAEFYGVSIVAANITVTSYLIGLSVGQLIGGATSDHIGRKPVGLMGLLIYLLSTLMIVYADSINAVLILRFTQALGGGFA